MANVRIELNRDSVRQLLTGPEISALTHEVGESIAAAAGAQGGTFEVSTRVGATRARTIVITADETARKAEAKDRALTRALDAGRR